MTRSPSDPIVSQEPEGAKLIFFPKLPAKIQGRIWPVATAEPRVIQVISKTIKTPHPRYRAVETLRTWSFNPNNKAPSLFFACHDSRTEVLKVYKPIRNTVQGSMTARIDPDKDALAFVYRGFCLSGERFFETASPEFLSRIRHVMLDSRLLTMWTARDSVWGMDCTLTPFTSLQRLDFAFHHHFDMEDSDVVDFKGEGQQELRSNGMCKTYSQAKRKLSNRGIDEFTAKERVVREGMFQFKRGRYW